MAVFCAQARISNRHRAGVVVQGQDLAARRAHRGAGALRLLCALSDQERVRGQGRVPSLAYQRRHLDVCVTCVTRICQHPDARSALLITHNRVELK